MSLNSIRKICNSEATCLLRNGNWFFKYEYDVCEFTFLNGGCAHVFHTFFCWAMNLVSLCLPVVCLKAESCKYALYVVLFFWFLKLCPWLSGQMFYVRLRTASQGCSNKVLLNVRSSVCLVKSTNSTTYFILLHKPIIRVSYLPPLSNQIINVWFLAHLTIRTLMCCTEIVSILVFG